LAVDELVDINQTRTRRRRAALIRIGVPVAGVLLVVASILGIAYYSYQVNRRGALSLSDAVLEQLQARIAGQVNDYLAPATQATLIAREMVARHAIPDGRSAIEGYAASMLNQVPHLEGFYVANSQGDFIMVRRDPSGGTDTKLILNGSGGARAVGSVHLDAKGHVVDTKPEPGDDFDPRTRVWYKGALATAGVYWSQPYIFYTTREPGITASIRLTGVGQVDRVFGVDITLEALSGFLAGLRIGEHGRAAILDPDGNVIAAPELATDSGRHGRQAVHLTVGELDDPAIRAAFDHYRVHGYGDRILTLGHDRFVTISSRLSAAGQDWVLLITAPEADFTGFARVNSRQNLLLSLITIGLAVLLGLLLMRQSRRAERATRLLEQQREVASRESQALSTLVAQPGLFNPHEPAPALTESLAEATAARRASIWRLAGDRRVLTCEDSYDAQHGKTSRGAHVEGLQLSRSELPALFDTLDRGESVELADAGRDPRTAPLFRALMRPFGSHALSLMPVHGTEDVVGAVMLEDAADTGRARSLIQAVSSLAALRMAARRDLDGANEAALGEHEAEDAAQPPPVPPSVARDELPRFSSALVREAPGRDGVATEGLAAGRFEAVTAMIIRFDDATVLAKSAGDDMPALADAIAREMQDIAERFSLPYLKLTGHHLVAAAGGLTEADPTGAVRLADAALAAREACLAQLAQAGLDPVFRIGVDHGAALGGALGEKPRLFNLWGDVIRNAELMAHSAPDGGTIQVTEAAYERLRHTFLFRPRGVFYVPRAGTSRTFILAGRR